MAVLKAKPEKFMQYLFPLLQRELVVPLITTRISMDNFIGAQGDTVSFRLPGLRTVARKYEWRTRTAPIVLDDIEGGDSIPITLGAHTYSATGLTDENVLMDEVELTREVLQPQAEAVARDLEADVVAAYAALPTRETVDFTENSANREIGDPYIVAVNANRALDRQLAAPKSGRKWLVGANVAAAILKHDRVSKFDWVGDSNTLALRDATIARLAGLDVVLSDQFGPNFSVVTHGTSLVLGTVAPPAPRGAAMSQAASQDGFAMRWLMDYDANYLRDRSIVSMFSGLTSVMDERNADGSLVTPAQYAAKTGAAATPKSARTVKVNFTPAA